MSWFDDPLPVSRQAARRDRARRLPSARPTAAGIDGLEGYAKRDGKFIALPLCAIGNAICLPRQPHEGGRLHRIPEGHRRLPRALQGAEGQGHARRLPARQGRRRRQQLRPLAALEPRRQDGRRGRQGRHQQPRDARAPIKYAQELYKTFIPGTESWLDINNNRAFLAGQVSLTANGVSLYYAAKKDPALEEIAEDIRSINLPIGPVGESVELHQTTLALDLQPHEVSRKRRRPISQFMYDRPTDERLDHRRQRLLLPAAEGLRRTTRSGPRTRSTRPTPRPRRRCARTAMPARSATPRPATMADYVLVDMFAAGRHRPDVAGRRDRRGAKRRANRYYRV